MQTGITVNMPATNNAMAMPDADEKGALIVTLTGDGKVYVGTRLIDPEVLSKEISPHLSAGKALAKRSILS